MFKQEFKLLPEIVGKGAYSKVQKCQNKSTGKLYAVKIVQKEFLSQTDRILLDSEIDILKKLDHPMTLRLHEIYENEFRTFIVTELCSGLDLFENLNGNGCRFNEAKAAIVAR